MRFFKYLVLLFLSLISFQIYAASTCQAFGGGKSGTGGSSTEACIALYKNLISQDVPSTLKAIMRSNGSDFDCSAFSGNGFGSGTCHVTCPSAGYPVPVYLPQGTNQIPTRMCKDGCSLEGSGRSIQTNNYVMTTMQYTGDSVDCNNRYNNAPPPCDTSNPYGECFVPPNSDCVRSSNGSIFCPEDSAPPQNQTCNGADYCTRPPEGCGSGYVSGSFNGQQLCVRSGPNNPPNPPLQDEPDNPNNCMNGGSYCPQPPNNTSCPSGYSETTYNGSKICVRNSPDSNGPNPNDPNNGGTGNPNNGGTGNPNNGGTGNPNNGGTDGNCNGTNNCNTNNDFDVSQIINSIASQTSSLTNSISNSVSSITSVLNSGFSSLNSAISSNTAAVNANGDKVKDAVDSNTAAVNANGDKVKDAVDSNTAAVNANGDKVKDAIDQTNDKLDTIFSDQGKEQIEQLGEPSNDPRFTVAESEMTSKLQSFANALSYSSSHACISDLTVTNIPRFGSVVVPLSKWCDLLALVKLLLKLSVLMLALRMIDSTVRVF